MAPKRFNNHRRFNDIFTVVIVIVILYIFVQPWIPAVKWMLHSPQQVDAVQQKVESYKVPDGHLLLIPDLALEQPIYDGPTAEELNKGVWRRPNTSTPPQYSNTVLAGHRFRYGHSTDAVFYNLDKVKLGTKIYVAWDDTMYTYVVNNIQVVSPSDIWVETATKDPQLVLYTCTPLWTSNQRLVITGRLEKEERER